MEEIYNYKMFPYESEMIFEGVSDEELIRRAKALHFSINVVECFSTGDVFEYYGVLDELEKRGYKLVVTIDFEKLIEEERDG
jgi:hypothetical protein